MSKISVADELRDEILRGFKSNSSISDLSKKYGLGRVTVTDVIKEAGLKPRRGRPPKAKTAVTTTTQNKGTGN